MADIPCGWEVGTVYSGPRVCGRDVDHGPIIRVIAEDMETGERGVAEVGPGQYGVIVICRPSEFPRRRVMHCPTCDRRRRFAGREAAWYGPTWTCLGCGDRWTDGECHPRPFAPRWREKAIAAGKAIWVEAGMFSFIGEYMPILYYRDTCFQAVLQICVTRYNSISYKNKGLLIFT